MKLLGSNTFLLQPQFPFQVEPERVNDALDEKKKVSLFNRSIIATKQSLLP